MYAMYCILILLTTIVASYGCLTEILDHGLSFKEAGLFLIAFYCMTLLYIICNEAHHASRKMGPSFREKLLNVNLCKYFEDESAICTGVFVVKKRLNISKDRTAYRPSCEI